MRRVNIVYLALVAGSLSSSCKKDDPAPAPESLLVRTSGWHLTAKTAGAVDVYSQLDDCVKDDILRFARNGSDNFGTFTIAGGSAKCSVDESQYIDYGTWALNFRKDRMTLVSQEIYTLHIDLLSLTENSMQLAYVSDASQETIIQTYVAQ